MSTSALAALLCSFCVGQAGSLLADCQPASTGIANKLMEKPFGNKL
jgi:hypothetical protein